MGSTRWSDDAYKGVVTRNVASHGSAFVHDADIKSGAAPAAVHNLLDPKELTVRESRDSTEHPESTAILVGLDVTGSMASVVRTIHSKLPTLLGLLLRKGYVTDPQVLFAAIGDATCDRAPLQVGQFESGVEMEGDLSKFFLEQGGGGQQTESYELFAFLGARKTAIDCLEKRGKKGYCFIIGDEKPYSTVKRGEVDRIIGGGLEGDIPVKQIFMELQEKYTTFYVLPRGASNGSDEEIAGTWKKLLGDEHVLRLQDANGIAELIATQIAMCEGTADADGVVKDLEENGTEKALVRAVTGSLSTGYRGGVVTKVPADALETTGGTSRVERI
jgi:hypothetical protein